MSTAMFKTQSTNFNGTIDPVSNTVTFVPPEGTPKVTGRLAEALAKAQKNFKTVLKDKIAKGEKFSYKYADLSSVLEMVVPCLSEQGIAFTQPLRREGDKTYVVTRIQLGEEFLEDAGLPIPSQVRPQELGTFLSYYRRYGVSTFLGIAADEDTDAVETRPDYKPESTSVQSTHSSYPRTATGLTNDTPAAIVKRGRPAVTKADLQKVILEDGKPKLVSDENANHVVDKLAENINGAKIVDSDLPDNIGDKASPEERKEFLARLKEHIKIVGVESMKKYMGGDTNLTKIAWTNVLAKLDAAQAEGKLKELVNV